MEELTLEAQLRNEIGKGHAKRMRRMGMIPAVLYGARIKSQSLTLDKKMLTKVLHTQAGSNVVLKLKVKDAPTKKDATVIVKEVQYDVVKGDIIHVDLSEISLTETLTVSVSLIAKGEAVGVKQEGGVLEHLLWKVDVECLPTNIPKGIEVDISNLKVGDSIFIKDLVSPEGVKILNPPDVRIINIAPPVKEKPKEEISVTGEPQEPELIRKERPTKEEMEEAQVPEQEKGDK